MQSVRLVDDERAERREDGRRGAERVEEALGGGERDVSLPLLFGLRRGHARREVPGLRADDRGVAAPG